MTANAGLDLSGPPLGGLVRRSVNGEAKPTDDLAGFIPVPIVIRASNPVPQPPQRCHRIKRVSSPGEYSFQTSPWSLRTVSLHTGDLRLLLGGVVLSWGQSCPAAEGHRVAEPPTSQASAWPPKCCPHLGALGGVLSIVVTEREGGARVKRRTLDWGSKAQVEAQLSLTVAV